MSECSFDLLAEGGVGVTDPGEACDDVEGAVEGLGVFVGEDDAGFLGDAPVMFISGYAEAEFSDLLEDEKGVTFLPKPLDIKVLAERVKQQLQAA